MKHSLKITSILIMLFFVSQIVGLLITNQYVKTKATPAGTTVVEVKPLPYNIERPPAGGAKPFFYILIGILIATMIILLLVRFKKTNLWRVWFFLAVFFCLAIAFNAFIPGSVAGILALILALWKIYKPGIFVQSFTEIFVYAGLAAIFVPILDIFWALMLLIAISIYDVIAVWKTKHMIKLAKFQAKSKIFAGLLIPYNIPKKTEGGKLKKKIKTAILGGGDIGMPLIFAGVIMKSFGFPKSLIISLFATIALGYLLFIAKKGKFYPAMPFISAGCILGYLIVLLF